MPDECEKKAEPVKVCRGACQVVKLLSVVDLHWLETALGEPKGKLEFNYLAIEVRNGRTLLRLRDP